VLADLDTFQRLGVGGVAVITAVTAQNRSRVLAVHRLSPSWITEQAKALLEEQEPQAIKIGMLGSAGVVRQLARLLSRLPDIPVVLDPVIRATAGATLLPADGLRVLKEMLLPRATVITPNLHEAGRLLRRKVAGRQAAIRAADDLLRLGPEAVVVTGGHLRGTPVDVLADERGTQLIFGKRVRTTSARGTGCRHSSALAAYLARGLPLRRAVRLAQNYLRRYLLNPDP
jgi:hydroxymethylpyrimidine/phosphomethylpyrimidine kinase